MAVETGSWAIRDAREHFPATTNLTYFNTAAVGLASDALTAAYHRFVDDWSVNGLDFVEAEAAAERSRAAVASLLGAEAVDMALIASVSAAAGLVAAQFGPANARANIVIGEREYSSNHFPWRLLTGKGYDIRQVPFRNGGLEPEDIAAQVDGGTRLIAVSAVQTASGHRSDLPAISAIAREVGALVFVDGAQIVGAIDISGDLAGIDILATPDHKFLMHAGRGLGYCYLSKRAQEEFTPVNAGWRAGAEPFASFFGPDMHLSATASRFDNSVSWIAAIGNDVSLSPFSRYGKEAVFSRNRDLADLLRAALADAGHRPVELPHVNRSTLVAVSLAGADPGPRLAELRSRGIICSARDGNLRFAVHFYNHEDDIDVLVAALTGV